ncbi:DUF3463 domain-containing protein [Streptomyces thinghirensis]|nr:DUF3463 domain-containing protein [Streptomyces thinghirensis]
MSDGYVPTYRELIEDTDWDKYGRGKDPRCANCMAHCGYEPTAVLATMGSPQGVPCVPCARPSPRTGTDVVNAISWASPRYRSGRSPSDACRDGSRSGRSRWGAGPRCRCSP